MHYSPNYINMMMAIGGVNALIGLASFVTGARVWFLLPLGVLLLVVSVNARSRPYFTIEQDKIVLHSFVGPLTRTFAFGSQEDIKLQGNNLYVVQNGKSTKIPVSKSITDPNDWASLEASYGQKQH